MNNSNNLKSIFNLNEYGQNNQGFIINGMPSINKGTIKNT